MASIVAQFEEGQPFLMTNSGLKLDDNMHLDGFANPKPRRIKPGTASLGLLSVQIILIILHIGLLAYGQFSIQDCQRPANGIDKLEFGYSPVDASIRLVVEDFDPTKQSPFVGKPRPELDQAWDRLLMPTVIRLTDDEMQRMNKSSIPLRDGSGYVGFLETYHMLHCIKRLQQSRYPAHYSTIAKAGGLSTHHLDHCLEVLREGVMCNAEVTVNTYSWQGERKLEGERAGPRRCASWDSIEAWANERAIVKSSEDFDTFYEQLAPVE